MDCMDKLESRYIEAVLDFLKKEDPEVAAKLKAQLDRTTGIAKMAATFPSLLESSESSHSRSASQSLVTRLCQVEPGMSSLNLPIRAVMGEAFLTAKIQLFQAFRRTLDPFRGKLPNWIVPAGDREIAQSLHTRLLAELLWDVVRSTEIDLEVRQRAATELARLWEKPDMLEVDDFFPMIEAVWQARNRISVTYGSLIGVTEFFQLVREQCPPQFVSYFTRQDVSADETVAFREFLFGLPHEELNRLKRAMEQQRLKVIDRKFVEEMLKLGNGDANHDRRPEALYASYRRRHRATELRRLTGLPGPRHTAEAYMILHLLEDACSFDETIRM